MNIDITKFSTFNTIRAEVTMFNFSNTFCGNPKIYVTFWDDRNEVRLTVSDNDDFDLAVIYEAKNQNEAKNIFHELVNFLNDVEYNILDNNTIFVKTGIGEFFPDLGCSRHYELE